MSQLFALRVQIERVLAGAVSPQEFERQFTLDYFERLPVELMRSEAGTPYSRIVERLEFVKDAPTADERAEEWIDYGEFVEWLRTEYATWQ